MANTIQERLSELWDSAQKAAVSLVAAFRQDDHEKSGGEAVTIEEEPFPEPVPMISDEQLKAAGMADNDYSSRPMEEDPDSILFSKEERVQLAEILHGGASNNELVKQAIYSEENPDVYSPDPYSSEKREERIQFWKQVTPAIRYCYENGLEGYPSPAMFGERETVFQCVEALNRITGRDQMMEVFHEYGKERIAFILASEIMAELNAVEQPSLREQGAVSIYSDQNIHYAYEWFRENNIPAWASSFYGKLPAWAENPNMTEAEESALITAAWADKDTTEWKMSMTDSLATELRQELCGEQEKTTSPSLKELLDSAKKTAAEQPIDPTVHRAISKSKDEVLPF